MPTSVAKSTATLKIVIPAATTTAASARKPTYVSPATKSIAISFTPTVGNPQTFNQNLTPASNPSCTASLISPEVCTVTFTLAPGNYTATFATYDGLLDINGNPTGSVLSQNQSFPVTIAAGQANSINVTLQGVPASVAFIPGPTSTLSRTTTAGFALSKCFAGQSVSVIGLDADGNYILGPGAPTPSLTSSDTTQVAIGAATTAAPNLFTLTRPTAPNANATISLTASVTPSGGTALTSTVNLTFDASICEVYTVYTLPTMYANPYGIIVAPNGDVWFTEYNHNKIGKLSGGTITEYSEPLSIPYQITVGPDNAVWFTAGNGGIGRVSMADGSVTTYATSGYPNSITTGSDGALWFTDYIAFGVQAVGRITIGGNISYNPVPPASNSLLNGITSGSDGALWFVDIGLHQVDRMTTSGSLSQFAGPWSIQASSDGETIVTGADGALWFSMGNSGQIIRADLSGSSTAYAVPGAYPYPQSAAEGSDHAVWFLARGLQSLGRIDTSGNFQEFPLDATASPNYITSGPDGSLWFTDSGRNAIVHVQ